MTNSQSPFNENTQKACHIADSRIIIKGNKVIIENLGPELIDLALALNPDDPDLIERSNLLKENQNMNEK